MCSHAPLGRTARRCTAVNSIGLTVDDVGRALKGRSSEDMISLTCLKLAQQGPVRIPRFQHLDQPVVDVSGVLAHLRLFFQFRFESTQRSFAGRGKCCCQSRALYHPTHPFPRFLTACVLDTSCTRIPWRSRSIFLVACTFSLPVAASPACRRIAHDNIAICFAFAPSACPMRTQIPEQLQIVQLVARTCGGVEI